MLLKLKNDTPLYLLLGFLCHSCNNIPDQNWEDINKVKLGMTYYEAMEIMHNNPISTDTLYLNKIENEEIVQFQADTCFTKSYESHFAASDDYRIYFRIKDSIVVNLVYGD
jgi:hypothetical protein